MDDVGLHHEVLVQELRSVDVVRVDPADFGCGEVDLLGFFAFEERINCLLVRKIQFRPGARDDVGKALRLQIAHDGRSDHAAVPCDENFYWRFPFR